MSVTLLLTTIAAQVGSAYFNSKRSKAQSAELAEQQQRLEEKIMLQGIENSREEYVQVCALQREIEQLMQKDRLELIQQNYLNSIELDAYNVSLEHWPLFTPPYVIKGQLIDGLSGANSTDAIPLNCIMTTSMHSKFNQKIFPQLEERLALFCSKHWSSSQPNSIRFYQNAWRDNIVDLGSRIIDLYAHLDDVPTIVLSPVVRNGKITFRIYWWGISGNAKDQHNNDAMVYDPDLAVTVTDDLALPEEQIELIIEELSNKLSALISYFADQYYWSFYKISPITPSLISMESISLSANELNEYKQSYCRLLSEVTTATSAIASHDSWGVFPALYGFVDENKYTESLKKFIGTKRTNNHLNSKDLSILESIATITQDSVEIHEIVSDAITFVENKEKLIKNQSNTFAVYKRLNLSLLDVLEDINHDDLLCGLYDSVSVVIIPDKFMVSAYCVNSKTGFVGTHINSYISKHFYMPKTELKRINKLSINIDELESYKNKISKVMTQKDLEKLFADSSENRDSRFSKVIDAFQKALDNLKKEINEERRRSGGDEVPMIVKSILVYEDLTNWIRNHSSVNAKFDGVFATIDKAGFFDKESYKMYVCFTVNKNPQLDENCPRVIFSFSKLDSALMDMFGNNKTIQINLNK